MKRWLPLLALICGLGFLGSKLLPPRNDGAFDLVGFGRLPVMANGRIKPLDTLARSSLLQIANRQIVIIDDVRPDGRIRPDVQEIGPVEWLLDVFYHPEKADTYRIFVIDTPDLLTLLGRNEGDLAIRYANPVFSAMAVMDMMPTHQRRLAFNDLAPHLAEIEAQAKLAQPVDDKARTPFQVAVLQLYGNLVLYRSLENAMAVPGTTDFLGDLLSFQQDLPAGVAAVRAKQANQPHDEALAQAMITRGQRFMAMAESSTLLTVPPLEDNPDANAWRTSGQALLESFQTGSVDSGVLAYAGLGMAWRHQRPDQFNPLVGLYRAELGHRYARQLTKTAAEARFNAAEPFYASMLLYAAAFALAVFSWLKWPEAMGRAAFWLVGLAWVSATAGIITRMFIEGRPPVTNLYSSALFVGWGAVALCLVLEAIYRNAIGSVAAGMIGFCTLLIAHHLSLGGDTMEMMRAVLDSNFWLATHVVVVTTGYASTFLAGFLALIYVLRGVCTRSLDPRTADALVRMVYGIVCFATLFSFIGTMLGGIWADQSWGRFWGWDPKENGALIIVVWNALILHARWGGMVRARGLMCLAIFGNIVTSWSWFGVNMLGIGLHSYGFTAAAFQWLSIFVASQLLVIALANLPLSRWRSFQARA
jgi:ABC-type transport system involved in cytochrome c biogenesis permease subunit